MGKAKAAPQFSESISSFCKLMENAQKDYAWNYDEVNRMDRLTQDFLHKLELDGLDYKERAKVATQLASRSKSRDIAYCCGGRSRRKPQDCGFTYQ